MHLRTTVCAGLMLAMASLSRADDWPEFRGPLKEGEVQNVQLPVAWGPDENVRWRTELPGEGWSSPVVIGDTVYVTAAVPSSDADASGEDAGYQLVLMALNVKTGELKKTTVLFSQPSTAPRIHKKNSHASPTPVFDGNRLYVHFGHQGIACVELDGTLVWRNDALEFPPVHGNGGSPVVVGDLVIFSRDGADVAEVVALDKSSGQVVWKRARDVEVERTFSFCTPLLLKAEQLGGDQQGGDQLVFPGSNVVQSLDPQTGDEIWRVEYDGYSVIPRPIFESGLVFICTGYNRPSLLAIDPTGKGNVTESHVRWKSNSNVPHTPSLIGIDGKILMVSDRGIGVCLDAKTGEETWKQRIGGNFSASPLLANGNVYLLSEEGVCTVLKLSDAPEEVAVNRMEERTLSSMAVVDNDIVLRTAAALYRIGD